MFKITRKDNANDLDLMEKSVEFQPLRMIFLAHLALLSRSNSFSVIFGCAQMRQPLSGRLCDAFVLNGGFRLLFLDYYLVDNCKQGRKNEEDEQKCGERTEAERHKN